MASTSRAPGYELDVKSPPRYTTRPQPDEQMTKQTVDSKAPKIDANSSNDRPK